MNKTTSPVQSQVPVVNGRVKRYDEFARIFWLIFLVLWFAYAFVHNLGCTQQAKQDIANFFKNTGKCATLQAEGALSVASSQLLSDIEKAMAGGVAFDSNQWKQTGISLAGTFGSELLSCAASSLFEELMSSNDDMGRVMASRRYSLKPEQKDYLKVAFEQSLKAKK